MLDPQQIRVFNIKYLVPGFNSTNNSTSLANSGIKIQPKSNSTTMDAQDNLGIGKKKVLTE